MATPSTQLRVSPLDISRHEFLAIQLEARDEAVETPGPLSLKVHRQWAVIDENPRHWRLVLIVEIGKEADKPTRYSGLLKIAGYFNVAADYPEDKIVGLVTVTGASILYGACREMLTNLTARSAHGIITLPSISFVSAPDGNEKSKPEARSSSEKRRSK